jgi:hypothetical protein
MVTPLDSLNNELDSVAFFRQDSFAVATNYEGKLANLVLSKEGLAQTIHFQPYTDSSYLHFMGTNGYEYFKVGGLGVFLEFLDNLITFDNFTFVDFFNSLEAWYSVYRFGETVNNEYTILTVDTTITTDSLPLPLDLRFEYLGQRLNDETITTAIGTFVCKKFLIKQGVSAIIIIPPFPPIVQPIAIEDDTVWIAEGNWIVQDIIPATEVDLSLIGEESFFLPGFKTEIIDEIVSVEDDIGQPAKFSLYQNYPNPFNPSTKIRFRISEFEFVSLKVYDVLGNEIAILVNEEKPPGSYEIEFNASSLASGIYFYSVQAGTFVDTKKMILMK